MTTTTETRTVVVEIPKGVDLHQDGGGFPLDVWVPAVIAVLVVWLGARSATKQAKLNHVEQAKQFKRQAERQEQSEHRAWLREKRFEVYSEALLLVSIEELANLSKALEDVAAGNFMQAPELAAMRDSGDAAQRLWVSARAFGDVAIAKALRALIAANQLALRSHGRGHAGTLTEDERAKCVETENNIPRLNTDLVKAVQEIIAVPPLDPVDLGHATPTTP